MKIKLNRNKNNKNSIFLPSKRVINDDLDNQTTILENLDAKKNPIKHSFTHLKACENLSSGEIIKSIHESSQLLNQEDLVPVNWDGLQKEKPYRSGLIPYTIKNNMLFFCLMVPSNEKFGGKFPQFPKGKIEKNKNPLENAIKEAEEEVGILRDNIVFIEFLQNEKERKTIWYLSKIKNFHLNEPHYESLYSFWIESTQCERIIKASQKPILQTAKTTIQRIENIEFS